MILRPHYPDPHLKVGGRVIDVLAPTGTRPLVELEWADRIPGRRALVRLNKVVQCLDYDAPALTEAGVYDVWRKPLVGPAILAAVLHALGFPCFWRVLPNDTVCWGLGEAEQVALEAQPWIMSGAEWLQDVCEHTTLRLRRLSRSVDRWLPPTPRERRVLLGRRRGVKCRRECNRVRRLRR